MLGSILLLVTLGLPVMLSVPVEESGSRIWAVLVAGSSEYENYRHQADVCHAYQILHRHGVPDSQIIVMMYDDIAQNPENPKKGQLFNKPGGPDVYKNVPKDYTGSEVTPRNFMNVLKGNSAALKGIGSGKALKSGPNDHVFVNFVDHGAEGMIAFPDHVMYADDLLSTLLTMRKQQMFKEMVFYLETCESGSMFEHILPSNIGGDEYSVAWMEDVDSECLYLCLHDKEASEESCCLRSSVRWGRNRQQEQQSTLTKETLLEQFRHVSARVKHSKPSMFGQGDIKNDRVVDFLGSGINETFLTALNTAATDISTDAVSSRDVALAVLEKKMLITDNVWERSKLQRKRETLLKKRQMVHQLFETILYKVVQKTNADEDHLVNSHSPLTLDMMPCYRTLVEGFKRNCLNINKNTYALSHLYKLANLCALEDLQVEDVLQIYAEECTENYRSLSGVE